MGEHEGEHEGAVGAGGTTQTQVVPGAEAPEPGQPPAWLPNGPGVDQWGKPLEIADEDPAKRSGAQNEVPPGDPASTPAGA